MWTDPIVEEIRQYRDAYAARFNYDLDAIYEDIQRQQREGGRKYVALTPTCPVDSLEVESKLCSLKQEPQS